MFCIKFFQNKTRDKLLIFILWVQATLAKNHFEKISLKSFKMRLW